MSKYYNYTDDDLGMPAMKLQSSGVTVLMNSFNETEELFRRAVGSVLKANPQQLILSTVRGDNCMEWIMDYYEDHPIFIVENEAPGIFQQINAMLPHIRGRYVCYASSNDIMLPHKLNEEAGILKRTKKKVCYSAFEIIESEKDRTYPADPYSYARNLRESYITDCAMVETQTFLKHTPFRVEYKNNAYLDLWLRIFEAEGDVFIPNNNPTWVYHVTKQSQHVRRGGLEQQEYLRSRNLMLKDHIPAAINILGKYHSVVKSIQGTGNLKITQMGKAQGVEKCTMTVALPTWKNKDVLYLPIEGLARQKCSEPWELIVMECEGDNSDLFARARKRLKRAGCVDIKYINSPVRVPLAQKWKIMAEQAKGDIFLLQASDDYPAEDRLQRTFDAFKDGCDWYQLRYHFHYSFKYRKIILFDMLSITGWLATGFNMAMKTEAVKGIPETSRPSGIDHFMFSSINPAKVVNDEKNPMGGVATDGLNSISKKRYTHYIKPKPPFTNTPLTLHEIGLPKEVVAKIELISMPEIEGIHINKTGKLVPVTLKRGFNGRRVGREYMVDEGVRNYMRFRGVLCENGESAKVKIDTI